MSLKVKSKPFRPMLASPAPDGDYLDGLSCWPFLGSPKYDGVRTLVRGFQARSRNLETLPNQRLQQALGQAAFEGLDGELIAGDPTAKDVFQRSQSAMKREAGIEDLCFYVFDTCLDKLQREPYTERLKEVKTVLGGNRVMVDGLMIQLVPQVKLKTVSELNIQEEIWVREGYEGLMLRRPDGHYKLGRSTVNEALLLKVKRWEHDEAEVFGAYELEHNSNEAVTDARGYTKRSSAKAGMIGTGKLGGFHVKMKTGDFKGVACDVGTGWTDEERVALWNQWNKAGMNLFNNTYGLLRVKWQKAGSKDRPRFPVAAGWRSRSDMS